MSAIFHTTMHFAFEKQRQSVNYDFSSNLSINIDCFLQILTKHYAMELFIAVIH